MNQQKLLQQKQLHLLTKVLETTTDLSKFQKEQANLNCLYYYKLIIKLENAAKSDLPIDLIEIISLLTFLKEQNGHLNLKIETLNDETIRLVTQGIEDLISTESDDNDDSLIQAKINFFGEDKVI